ncbi:MAG: tRNA (N(6)-L-threonylcarbamoyladenosine(37)-C(2))-methylthiotransferase MtaB [Desulfosudaceae bacterium]
MKQFAIKTLGCKVNQFESEAIAASLEADGWCRDSAGPVALCIVNTCTVTGRAAMQSRQAVRRCRREHPGALVVAAGCYATVDAGALRATGCADLIVTHAAKHRLPELIRERLAAVGGVPELVDESDHPGVFPCYPVLPVGVGDRARPFLKIQDGCNAFCTYCIVPHARGRSVSMPAAEVLSRLEGFSAAGYAEVVLTGIHLGAYGRDLPEALTLLDLLQHVDGNPDLPRIRLSSIEPLELTDEIIDLAGRSDMICDHFHIPLQSGADWILKKMGRPYSAEVFTGRVERIRRQLPRAAIGADLLVGFPGEDESAFGATFDLIRGLPLTYLHVFPFSPRRGTPAFDYPDHVSSSIIRERCRCLRELGERKKAEFARRQKGTTTTIRVEDRRDRETGCLKGVTANYLTVLLDGGDVLQGQKISVRIGEYLEGLRVRGFVRG